MSNQSFSVPSNQARARAANWAVSFAWEDLCFLHWRVDADLLRAHIPRDLEIDTYDNSAWIGVVPFRMVNTRHRWLPHIPSARTFPELNVRTYVKADGRRGVWFVSLDAASRIVVEGARITFGLPYYSARMSCVRTHDEVSFRSDRRDARGAAVHFSAQWQATGAFTHAREGSLEHFLVERDCLFAMRRSRLICGEIAHVPWHLARGDARVHHCTMTEPVGVKLLHAPDSVLVAERLEVLARKPFVWPRTR